MSVDRRAGVSPDSGGEGMRGCYVDLKVNIGKSPPLKHRFMALEIAVPIIILGRDFLRQFNSTEFDWKNQRAKLEMSDVNRSFLVGWPGYVESCCR